MGSSSSCAVACAKGEGRGLGHKVISGGGASVLGTLGLGGNIANGGHRVVALVHHLKFVRVDVVKGQIYGLVKVGATQEGVDVDTGGGVGVAVEDVEPGIGLDITRSTSGQ